MKISVIGLGYLGTTHAVAMAKLGHQVIGIETNESRLERLESGFLPFYEPGLSEALDEVRQAGSLKFQKSLDNEVRDCEIHFICVGTPQKSGSRAADLSHVMAAGQDLAPYLDRNAVVAGKSTIPVGFAATLRTQMSEVAGFEVNLAWNPEFLREGTALADSLKPDRIVVGSWSSLASYKIRQVYAPMIEAGVPFLSTDVETAELVKVAANSFLATKISFINAMAEVAEVVGADTVALAEAIGYDERIGNKFLRSGIGFGGGCLPKDIRGFVARAEELGCGEAVSFLREIDDINQRRRVRVESLARQELGDLKGKKILMLGISFKPDSDDLRDSPSLDIALRLARAGANVTVHDPLSLSALGELYPELTRSSDLHAAASGQELVILGTEWADYQQIDPAAFGEKVAKKLVIDGRNVLDVTAWQASGWKLIALGRNVHQ